MWKEQIFWFSQPSVILNNYDKYFFWFFVGLTGLGIVLKALAQFNRHPVWSKLWNKFGNAGTWMGVIGLLWFGLRYENTPVFADRYWAASIGLILVVWLVFVFKYMFTKFREEKGSYDRMQVNSRYIPGSKK